MESIPKCCWTRKLNEDPPESSIHSPATPPFLEILKLLPVAYRISSYIDQERKLKKEPIFDLNGATLQPPNPGPHAGAPVGGIGSGSIGRGFKGEFRRWSIHPGRYIHKAIAADVFVIRAKIQNTIYTKVLSLLQPEKSSCLHSWDWTLPSECGTYHALFPRAWNVYNDPIPGIDVIIKQIAPFLPGIYPESSLPVGVFEVEVVNKSEIEDIEVSVMFVFQNGLDSDDDPHRSIDRCEHKDFEASFHHPNYPVHQIGPIDEQSTYPVGKSELFPEHIKEFQDVHRGKHIEGVVMRQDYSKLYPKDNIMESVEVEVKPAGDVDTPNGESSSETKSYFSWFQQQDSHQYESISDEGAFTIAGLVDAQDEGKVAKLTVCREFITQKGKFASYFSQQSGNHNMANAVPVNVACCAKGLQGSLDSVEGDQNSGLMGEKRTIPISITSSADYLWQQFAQYGDITDIPDQHLTPYCDHSESVDDTTRKIKHSKVRLGSAVCIRQTIGRQSKAQFVFSLAWSFPKVRFGNGTALPRYYTKYFGHEIFSSSANLATFALTQYHYWERYIVQWQENTIQAIKPVLRQGRPDQSEDQEEDKEEEYSYYYSQVFNELYYLVDGGSCWLDSAQGISNQSCIATNQSHKQTTTATTVFTFEQQTETLVGSDIAITGLLSGVTTSESFPNTPSSPLPSCQSPVYFNKSQSPQSKHSLTVDLQNIYDHFLVPMHHDNCLLLAICGDQSQIGQFLYLEGHEYLMYNTYDVHFYAGFALLALFPQLEYSLQYDIVQAIGQEDLSTRVMMGEGVVCERKIKDAVPHDVGSPSEFPWSTLNAYNFQDVSHWKDLSSKFILQVYRNVYALQENLRQGIITDRLIDQFHPNLTCLPSEIRHNLVELQRQALQSYIERCYPLLLRVMERMENHFITASEVSPGMIQNSGFPDQTYDIWIATGTHCYCGGLWITACHALANMASWLEDLPHATHFTTLAHTAQTTFQRDLWNGFYLRYDNSESAHADSLMADMLAGQWYAQACGLPDILDHPKKLFSCLKLLYYFNVVEYGQGQSNRGAVNGMRPPALLQPHLHALFTGVLSTPLADLPSLVHRPVPRPLDECYSQAQFHGKVDQTCLQSREVWTGTTYALAAAMLQEALLANQQPGRYSALQQQELYEMAWRTAQGVHDAGWQDYGYWFATPEAWTQSGQYRSLGYMRPLSIWAMQYAINSLHHSQEEGDSDK